ncbi:nicotinamidase-related amidase [Paraburkholderia sp. GAS206C]|jgi:nicotinamidase-related amidase|uniref:cysteine hydrolase family protein n=1 Tax=unclassified Paraburkholderia TaxID=2615204 RepID=UPI003D25D521
MSEKFSLHPGQSALLVMDYQKMLLENYVPADQVDTVLANTAAMIAAARIGRMAVIYVTVAFRPGHPEVSARNRLFMLLKQNGLFARGDVDTSIHPALAPAEDEPVVIKHRVGAFTGTDLEILLRASGIETLVLAGITTAGVVLSTVRQAFDMDYRALVAGDCCADPNPDVHQMLLDKVIAQHAEVVSARRIIDALSV